MANIIYNSNEAKKNLDKLTFIYVCDKIKEKVEEFKTENKDFCLIDAPLLYEANLQNICDYTVAVISNLETKLKRICLRDNINKETALKRLKIQGNDEFYTSKANFIIFNNENEGLDIQIKKVCEKIK